MTENSISFDKHACVIISEGSEWSAALVHEVNTIRSSFCGRVYTDMDVFNAATFAPDAIMYFVGNTKYILDNINPEHKTHRMYVVSEVSTDVPPEHSQLLTENLQVITCGQVPLLVHGVGIMFRKLFNTPMNIYDQIKAEHEFQKLTQSNKGGSAFRKGIYITDVTKTDEGSEFNLLRCSTNLDGPTDNFRATDRMVIDSLNNIAGSFFDQKTELNHVLAQIYENTVETTATKTVEKKATIKAHSDKTKDMPTNAIMAFCTFYSDYTNSFDSDKYSHLHRIQEDMFDLCRARTSAFSTLYFKLKTDLSEEDAKSYVSEFSVKLYPNSVFFIPLSTNRIYTHEIRASLLHVKDIPTRMGYVVRCSKTKAIYKDDATHVIVDGVPTKLRPITDEDQYALRTLYYNENVYSKMIDYGTILFSMNEGDYKEPIA